MSNFNTNGYANMSIRNRAKEAGVPMWKLAAQLGMSETTISRRLRTELPQPEQKRWLHAIDILSERAGSAEG